jgi:ubiquinone/menaquinone biosynthesis C-methylase UbiE
MSKKPNAQYNLAGADSLSVRVATRVRKKMFERFMDEFLPQEDDIILDLGVTSDDSYSSSNYFEELYPYKNRITAAGIDDAIYLEKKFPGVRFQFANALSLPFDDQTFDYVHSSAVLEHVGSAQNQRKMLSECLRVARKGVFITTPDRWFPVEFHTQLPLVHWLPKPWFRCLLMRLGQHDLASEDNLNLLTVAELRNMAKPCEDWQISFSAARLLGWNSNILLIAHRAPLQA